MNTVIDWLFFIFIGVAFCFVLLIAGSAIPLAHRKCSIQAENLQTAYKFDRLSGMCLIRLKDGRYMEIDKYKAVTLEKEL